MYYPIKPRGNRKIINSYIYHPSFKDVDIDKIIIFGISFPKSFKSLDDSRFIEYEALNF